MVIATASLALLLLVREPPLEQIAPGDRDPGNTAEQISEPDDTDAAGPVIEQAGIRDKEASAADQLTHRRGQSKVTKQLAPERDEPAKATTQLHPADKTAEAPEALSKRAEGRQTKVSEVEGQDRCDDPDLSDELREYCAHVIETRAEEFVRPDPLSLTEEQKLSTEQPTLTGKKSIDTVSRRLSEDAEPSDLIEQGVAAVVYDSTLDQIDRGDSTQPEVPREPFSGQSVLIGPIANTQSGP